MLDRREFLVGSAAALPLLGRQGAERRPAPNVLFLISDQHRADVAGFAGDPFALTPNLDRFAASGTVVETMYCQAPLCVPARQSLLTGLYAHDHGSFRNWTKFPTTQRTLAHEFADAGYDTALIGKSHCNTSGFARATKQEDLFARFQAENDGGRRAGQESIRRSDDELPRDMRVMNPRSEGAGEGPVFHMERDVTASVQRYLTEQKGDKPFFLWASYLSPHPPLFPPQEFLERFLDRDLPVDMPAATEPIDDGFARHRELVGLDRAERKHLLGLKRSYYAAVAWMDHCVGQVLDTLDAQGLADNTLVVYTSDHGEMLGQHGRIQKGVFFEGAVRVPCIVRMPGTVRKAARVKQVTQHVDLSATLFDLTSLKTPPSYVGRSLARLLATGRDRTWEDFAFSEKVDGRHTLVMPSKYLHQMLRNERYKFMRLGVMEEALFDLQNDPGETTNLIERPEHRNLLQSLRAKMTALSPEMVTILDEPESRSKR